MSDRSRLSILLGCLAGAVFLVWHLLAQPVPQPACPPWGRHTLVKTLPGNCALVPFAQGWLLPAEDYSGRPTKASVRVAPSEYRFRKAVGRAEVLVAVRAVSIYAREALSDQIYAFDVHGPSQVRRATPVEWSQASPLPGISRNLKSVITDGNPAVSRSGPTLEHNNRVYTASGRNWPVAVAFIPPGERWIAIQSTNNEPPVQH
jgi:hypothetical protein